MPTQQNLVNASIDAATMTSLQAIPAQVYALLPFLLGMTNAERKSLRKMGPKQTGYVNAVYAGLMEHQTVLPSYYSLADFTTDKLLADQMPLVIEIFEGILERIKDTDLRLRHEMIKQADAGYKHLKTAADNGNLEVKQTVNSIAKAYPSRGKMRGVSLFSIASKASIQVINVVVGSTFTNTGETVLKVSAGSETISGVKKGVYTLNPGNTLKIPAGWTSITVENKSTDTDGGFAVKTS